MALTLVMSSLFFPPIVRDLAAGFGAHGCLGTPRAVQGESAGHRRCGHPFCSRVCCHVCAKEFGEWHMQWFFLLTSTAQRVAAHDSSNNLLKKTLKSAGSHMVGSLVDSVVYGAAARAPAPASVSGVAGRGRCWHRQGFCVPGIGADHYQVLYFSFPQRCQLGCGMF